MNAPPKIPKPDTDTISAFLYTLFAPDFVHAFPDAWIEIVFIRPDGKLIWSFVSAHDLETVVDCVIYMNSAWNCYVGAALRHGEQPKKGRAGKEHFCAASHFWADCDDQGCFERAVDICKREQINPSMVHTTGTAPHTRAQIWIKSAQPVTDIAELETATAALRDAFDSDHVQNADRIMRIPGTVNFPPPHKIKRGYGVELTTLQIARDAPTYSVTTLSALRPTKSTRTDSAADASAPGKSYADADHFQRFADSTAGETGRLTDADIDALLAKHANGTGEKWHSDLLAVTDEMLKRGCDTYTIRRAIADACKDGINDRDIGPLIDKRWLELLEQKQEAERETASAKAKASSALALTYYKDLTDPPPKPWIIKGVLARGETSNWFGPPGVGKSVLMTDLIFHVASGWDWRGYRSKERCGVVYLALERGALVKRRLSAYMRNHDKHDLPIAIASNVIDLKNKGCIKLIVDTIREAEARFACKVGMIVVDTISKGIAAGGGDEDKAKDVNIVLANLRRVEELTNIHIACVGHTGKDEGRGHRGSNANVGDMDLMVQIAGDASVKTATVIKINDGQEGPLTHYKIESAQLGTDEDGDAITTAIISDEAAEAEREAKAKRGLSDAQRRALELLTRCINDHGRPPPPSREFPQNVRVVLQKEWHTTCERGSLSSAEKKADRDKAFRRAWEGLQSKMRIACLDGWVWLVRDDV